jgi:hypothetical protein
MVDHDAQPGVAFRNGLNVFEVTGKDRDIVEGDSRGLEHGEPLVDVGTQDEVGVGVVVDEVAHPDDPAVSPQFVEPQRARSGSSSGTKATTATISGFARATSSMKSVSSSLSADCTRTVAWMPARRSDGRSASNVMVWLIGECSAVSQSYRARARSQTCWCESIVVMRALP